MESKRYQVVRFDQNGKSQIDGGFDFKTNAKARMWEIDTQENTAAIVADMADGGRIIARNSSYRE